MGTPFDALPCNSCFPGSTVRLWSALSLQDAGASYGEPPSHLASGERIKRRLYIADHIVVALRRTRPRDIPIFVGGHPYGSRYREVPLTAHALIALEIGGLVQPPTTQFTFPAGE